MRHVAIIFKRMRPEAAKLANELRTWLEDRNIEVFCEENIDNAGVVCGYQKIEIPKTVEAVIVVGGDGTLLSVARTLETRPVPIVGINLGGLGFLTEVSVESCYRQMERLIRRDFEIEERMRLDVMIYRAGRMIFTHRVLNDAVINKGALARIIDLETTIDGRFLTHYRGDGLIIATPTGSTAYNLAAGGPIVYPTAHSIILTPICSFTLSNRPIILPAQARITLELAAHATDVTLTCDGQVGCLLETPDQISITAAAVPLRLIKTPDVDHFDILRRKLNWGQS